MRQSLTLTPPQSGSNESPTTNTLAPAQGQNANWTGAAPYVRVNVGAGDTTADSSEVLSMLSGPNSLSFKVRQELWLEAVQNALAKLQTASARDAYNAALFTTCTSQPTSIFGLMQGRTGTASLFVPSTSEKQDTADDLDARVKTTPLAEVDVVMVAHFEGWRKPRRFRDPFADE